MTPQDLPLYSRIICRWHDSSSHGRWQNVGEIDTSPVEVRSIGFVAASSPESVTITTSLNDEIEACLAPVTIPWTAITQLEILP